VTLLLLLVLLAAVVSAGLFAFVKGRVERPETDVSELVVQRLHQHAGQVPVSLRDMEMEQPFTDRVVRPLLRRGGDIFARTTPAQQRESLQANINRAGKYSLDTGTFLVLRAAAGLGMLLVGLMLGNLLGGGLMAILLMALFAGIGYVLPVLWLKRLASQRVKEMRRALPDVLDLLTITVQAGLSFDAALARVAERYRGTPMGQEFNQLLQEVRLGKPRLEALVALGERCRVDEIQNFTQAVVQSEHTGIGIGRVLSVQAQDLRSARIQRAKEKAGRATLLMLLPMVGCIFPTLFIVLLGPAVIALIAMRIF
jgi:tight adherence protein C